MADIYVGIVARDLEPELNYRVGRGRGVRLCAV